MGSEVDFVIPWVDGSDKRWQEDKRQYQVRAGQLKYDSTQERYRDWGLLKYWFRSVEQNAPWFRKIHFITYGHLPDFLVANHPKLNIVYHSDYMPQEYLPTFSSHPIELNMHRIKGLSERFVYFNDDMFLNIPLGQEYFFRRGKPCYEAVCALVQSDDFNEIYYHILLNDMALVNEKFDKYAVLKNHFFKWFSLRYGKELLRNILLLPWDKFQNLRETHSPCPFLKSTLEEVWDCKYDILHRTSMHKFRDITDVNQYIFRYWSIMEGEFMPCRNRGKVYHLNHCDTDGLLKDIQKGKSAAICINDGEGIEDRKVLEGKIIRAFEERYPQKSTFEQ